MSKKTKKADAPVRDWTPRRNGDIYCAPACGGNCTIDAYLLAQIRGKALAESLGPGWRPTINENLGWHYGAESSCGRLYVVEHGIGTKATHYICFLGEPFSRAGKWTGEAKTAKGSVKAAIQAANESIRGYIDLLDGVAEVGP